MQLPLQLQRSTGETLQSQIFSQVRGLILSRRLRSGAAVPSTRELSRQLGLARNTVLLAYNRLITEGYLETHPTSGTFVSRRLPEESLILRTPARKHNTVTLRNAANTQTPPQRPAKLRFKGRRHTVFTDSNRNIAIDFKVGRPDPDSFPRKQWRKLMLENLARGRSNLTEYNDPAGLWGLRQAVVDHLGPARGIATSAENALITAGTQEALNIVARLFIGPDTRAVVEYPCYQGAAYLFESYGAELVPIPIDSEGITVASLPSKDISLAYLTPSHQYPLGCTLSLERRIKLLEWASEQDIYLIEDDYDSDFRHHGSPLTALKGLDHMDHVIYLGTFSKSIGASLRLGYMALPNDLVGPARDVKTLLNNSQPWLEQAVMADFIGSGAFSNHLRRIRQTYLKRRDHLVAALRHYFGDVDVGGLEGGMHIVWRLPDGFPSAAKLQELARANGVAIYSLPAGAAYVRPGDPVADRIVLLGYSSLTEDRISDGVRRMHDALHTHADRRNPARGRGQV